jgi:glycosyltransferase involved in cell wall biosynthesis
MFVVIDAVGIRGHGGATILCELLHWLPIVQPEWKWHVILFERDLREFDDPPIDNNITIEHTRLGNSRWQRIKWVRWQLKEHVQGIGADALFAFANMGSDKPCIPQVLYVQQTNAFLTQGITAFTFFQRLRFWMIRQQILLGAKASSAVIVQTETVRQRMLSFASDLGGRIYVIPSGYRTPSAVAILRPEKKFLIDGANRPRLIYVGHPSYHKNHMALLRAMPRILEVFPSANLLLTLEKDRSSFPPSYGEFVPLIESLRKEAERLSVSQRLVWLGILDQGEVEYALQSSDLMVFPSLTESFGLGLVESMVAKCPVAAADLPYAHDVCGDAAVYFNPNDSESIANTIIAVCSDEAALARLRSNGAERKSRFSYQRIAEEIASVLELATEVKH